MLSRGGGTGEIEEILEAAIKLLTEGEPELAREIHNELRYLSFNFDEIKRTGNELKVHLENLRKILASRGDREIEEAARNLLTSLHEFGKNADRFTDNYCLRRNAVSLILTHSQEFTKALNEIEDLLRNFKERTANLREILREKRKLYYSTLSASRENKQIESNIKNVLKILNNLYRMLTYVDEIIEDHLNINVQLLFKMKTITSNERAFELAKFIKDFSKERIWIHQLISQLTGLRSIAGELRTYEVTFRIPGKMNRIDESDSRTTLDELLIRYPPFEPIHDEVNGVMGSNVWFIAPKNARFHPRYLHQKYVSTVLNGRSEDILEGIRLVEVETIDLMNPNTEHEITLEIVLRIETPRGVKTRPLWVKYGSRRLYYELESRLKRGFTIKRAITEIQSVYEQSLSKLERGAYKVNDLGYVWYCRRGYAMSTDPYDLQCPFMNSCFLGQQLSSRGARGKSCPNWHYGRRLFPKVYVESNRHASSKDLKRENPVGVFTPVYGRGVVIIEYYTGAQWYMPSAVSIGNLARIEFDKPIVKELPSTNVVGFSLPLRLVKALVYELIDESVRPKPEVPVVVKESGEEVRIPLSKLLLSKFIIHRLTGGGYNQLGFLQSSRKSLIKKVSEEIDKLRTGIVGTDEYLEYITNVLGHTLAHLFFQFISTELEIEPANLSYLHLVDMDVEELLILVFENSPHGVIDLPRHVLNHFASYQDMLEKFVNFVIEALGEHKREMLEYKKRSLNEVRRRTAGSMNQLASIATKIEEEWYVPLCVNSIVMDVPTFTFNLFLSGAAKEIADENNMDRRLLERQLESLVRDYTGIIHCIDGCPACVILEQGCFSALTQNLTTSRNLVEWLLKVLAGREAVHGRGSTLIEPLLSIAKREVVVLSPYIDEEGVEVLERVASKGVPVTLLTREENTRRYGYILRMHGVKLQAVKERHDKLIVIDDEIVIEMSQNLAGLRSINMFRISRDSERARNIKAQLIQEKL